jgi:hypothetical protein
MKSVNKATAMMLDRFRGRMRQRVEQGAENPLTEMDGLRQSRGQAWADAREPATEALRLWLIATIGNCMLNVLREIAAVAASAEDAGKQGKAAAYELSRSWEFLQHVFGSWLEHVDVEYIAEVLIDDYVEGYVNAPPAATEPMAPPPPPPTATSAAHPDDAAIGSALEKLFRRAKPSVN